MAVKIAAVTESVHLAMYRHLEEMIRGLDDSLELKLSAIVFAKGGSVGSAVRVKRLLGDLGGDSNQLVTDRFDDEQQLLHKLGLSLPDWDYSMDKLEAGIRDPIRKRPDTADSESGQAGEESALPVASDPEMSAISEERFAAGGSSPASILYPSSMDLTVGETIFRVIYIVTVDYASSHVQRLFYEQPHLSFLRMMLQYFFADFYEFADTQRRIVKTPLESRYKENATGFLQRMARLFYGKIQQEIIEVDLDDSKDATEPTQQYYVNTLMEKIEGIATRTYEGANPFGCMLLLSQSLLGRPGLVQYAIQFGSDKGESEDSQQGIALTDAKRIRKLLEMTNNERDLFLIADAEKIYGVGEVDWSELGEDHVFKLEFKGLSRYDLVMLQTGKMLHTDKRMGIVEDQKIFTMTTSQRIVASKLLGVSFKNPEIAQEQFDAELFRRIAAATFRDEGAIAKSDLDTLAQIIKEATLQQSGTMVVVTNPTVAREETQRLRKQSTLIKEATIQPTLIKYLTAIDGAIYCDTKGCCHAVGVILDGLAQKDIGDASRGARFNSAHRYLAKLREDGAACMIAIISEDGMVNLIPEPITERRVRQIVGDYVDYIRTTQKDQIKEETVNEYEERLKQVQGTAWIDQEHYCLIGKRWFEKENYKKAVDSLQKGIRLSDKPLIEYRRMLAQSLLRYAGRQGKEDEQTLFEEMYQVADYIVKHGGKELIHEDYNLRAIASHRIGKMSEIHNEKSAYFQAALDDYSQAIGLRKDNIIYANRANLYVDMNQYENAMDDLLSAEAAGTRERQLKQILNLAASSSRLLAYALIQSAERMGAEWGKTPLGQQLIELGQQQAAEMPEVAAALEQLEVEKPQPDDSGQA